MLRVQTIFSGTTGAPYVSTMFFSGSGAVSATAANATVGDFWEASALAMSDDLTWTTSEQVADMTNTGTVTAMWPVTPITGDGTATSERVARAVQALVRWQTGVYANGRQVRGRTFVPGATEGMNANGEVLPLTQTILNDAATALLEDTASQLVIWSRTAGTITPVLTGSTWNEWAMLTSRRD